MTNAYFPKFPLMILLTSKRIPAKHRKKQDTEFEKDVPNIISSYWSLTKPDLIFICI